MTHHRLLRIGAAVLFAGSLLAATSVAAVAGPESDIPGIPLPSPVVSGPLGGPIYDVVYRVNVPAGYVLVAGLTGTPGTDFDLYLFDASATTVVSNTGLLTKSTGPTSTEHLSWPTRIDATFYVDLNGASDVEGTYTLSVQVVPDPTPPLASLSIQGGATRVNTTAISLLVDGFDDLSGVSEMSLSNDGQNWLPWQPFSAVVPWVLPDGDGPKTIWVRVENGVGLVSAPATVNVFLDTQPPVVVRQSPTPGSIVTNLAPTFSVAFDEPVDPGSWGDLGLVVQSSSGGIVPGAYAYYPSISTGTFTPAAPLSPGLLYLVAIGDVRDLAGNRVAPTASWTLKVLLPARVSLSVTPTVTTFGQSVVLAGRLALPEGGIATLETRMPADSSFSSSGSIVPISGAYRLSVSPATNVTYRVTYPGNATTVGATSDAVRVLVRRWVVLLGSGPATTRTARAGHVVAIIAQLRPAGAGVMTFRAYRYSPARGAYVLVNQFVRAADSAGRATVNWTPSAGRWRWDVVVPPSPQFANNRTALYRWSVTS